MYTNWYEKKSAVSYATLRIIMRSQKALKYKLGIFGDMSLSKYLSVSNATLYSHGLSCFIILQILNAAYSYVMLLTTVK